LGNDDLIHRTSTKERCKQCMSTFMNRDTPQHPLSLVSDIVKTGNKGRRVEYSAVAVCARRGSDSDRFFAYL